MFWARGFEGGGFVECAQDVHFKMQLPKAGRLPFLEIPAGAGCKVRLSSGCLGPVGTCLESPNNGYS